MNDLVQYIYDYPQLTFLPQDFQKRKRVKNIVPFFERCCALRANGEQCTRRKKTIPNFVEHTSREPHMGKSHKLKHPKHILRKPVGLKKLKVLFITSMMMEMYMILMIY